MTTIDLSPLYRSSIGLDRLASMLDSARSTEQAPAAYPPYNIEMTEENRYTISLAVAGFSQQEIDIQIEKGVLTISGKKTTTQHSDKLLHQGFALRPFERKFNLAEHVEVSGAELRNGLLTIRLQREIPPEMQPRKIEIETPDKVLEHQPDTAQTA